MVLLTSIFGTFRRFFTTPKCVSVTGFVVFGLFLLSCHYVMAYSDPNHWIQRAEALADGQPQSRRVLLFPLYLLLWLRTAGPDWVFLANLPLLIGLTICLTAWTRFLLQERSHPTGARNSFATILVLVLCYFWFRSPFLRILNPYRDAGAFLLVTAGSLAFFKSDKEAHLRVGFLAGFLSFLSLGFRETTIITMLPLLGWGLFRLVRDFRNPQRWKWVGMVSAGILLGSSPFLYQNWLYSGNAWIPAYSASRVLGKAPSRKPKGGPNFEQSLHKASERKLDISFKRLVPGMHPEHFRKNFPKTIRKCRERIGHLGSGLLVLGLLISLIKRNRLIWGFLVPAACLNAFFFAMYKYVNNRYILLIPILLVPVAAYAGVTMLEFGIQKCRRKQNDPILLAMSWVLMLVLSGNILYFAAIEPPRVKVWHLATFRRTLSPHLESPRTFLGYYHHREMLAWALDQDFNHQQLGSGVDSKVLKREGLEASLVATREELSTWMEESALYFHHEQHAPELTPLWFKHQPVVDLSSLPVQLMHYGRPLQFQLLQIVPWDNPSVQVEVKLPDTDVPHVLLLNARRIWDDPLRTTAQLRINGHLVSDALTSDVNFIEVPPQIHPDGHLDLQVSGDLPFPDRMPVRSWPINGELKLNLGRQPDWWFHALLDETFKANAPLRKDAARLFDQGTLTLPSFADSDLLSFAELRYEFYQKGSQYQVLHESFQHEDRSWVLPTPNKQIRATFKLGSGNGHLQWHPLSLITSLPGYREQRTLQKQGLLEDFNYLKIFDATIYTIPGPHSEERLIRLGTPKSGAYLQSGFFWKEKHLGRYPVRWTGVRCNDMGNR